MSTRKAKFITLLKSHASPNALSKSDPAICSEVKSVLTETESLLEQQTVSRAINYILWKDLWVTDGVFTHTSIPGKQVYRFPGGRLIFVDLGCGNIGHEMSFPHPAIVLGNYTHTLLIAPCSSDDGTPIAEDEAVIKVPNSLGFFVNDSLIYLHQIRTISKSRVISDLKLNAKNYLLPAYEVQRLRGHLPPQFDKELREAAFPDQVSILDALKRKLAQLYASSVLYDMTRSTVKIKQLEEENRKLLETIQDCKPS